MTIRAKKFTAEVLLSAPRRSPATPNADGTLALFTTSTYCFQSHAKTSEICVLDIASGNTFVLTNELSANSATWVGDSKVLWLQGENGGKTAVMLGDAKAVNAAPSTVAVFDGPMSNLKLAALGDGSYAFAVTGPATPSGDLFNPETAPKSHSTGKVYTSLFVRHWDAYVTENTSSIWYSKLEEKSGGYELNPKMPTNALKGLECPVPPFGGSGDFDISKSGICFVAKDPELNPANYTKTDLYYMPLDSFSATSPPKPHMVKTGNLRGYSASPVFSPDAKSIAFTRMKSQQYESDKPRLLMISNVHDLANVVEFYQTKDGEGAWDLRPESIVWSHDGSELYVTAEDKGRGKLFKLPSDPKKAVKLPTPLTDSGTVSQVNLLAGANPKLLISSSSLVDNSYYSIVDPEQKTAEVFSSNSKHGRMFGLHKDQVSEIWFPGADNYEVHAWVVKPSFFDKNKKYPLAYLIHGGPQGAWGDSWSTRWNPAVFAEQGYVVVTPNPTGSTGYGMELENGIRNNWGGRPYHDLVNGFEYIDKNLPFVDTSRAVALGASYGGFMVNWIQGHELGRKFKALVTHDGVFCTLNQYSSEEIFFPHHDFAGTLYENRENYEKWDPSKHIDKWATPHLIIHNELDYRLPISEGLAPFNVLQLKGIPSKFLTFPDENHWVLKPENSLVWHREVIGWINKYSGIDQEQDLASSVSSMKV